jgi:S-layer protein (TIGR01567 family)
MEIKNKLYSTALVSILLVLLLILAPSTVSASLVQKVEISGPVYNGSDIDDIIDTHGDGITLTIDATQFSAFYYDIDNNVATETLSIRDVYGTSGNVIGEGGLVYQTTIQATKYRFTDWGMYPVICLFTEEYIPLNFDKADKFCKLVLDSDDKYTIGTGETLDLGAGYAIEVKQIDINGSKVWLEFTRDGEYVDDEIVSVVDNGFNTWEVELDGIQGEDDVVVLRVHVNQIFQGAAGRIAQIQGIWIIDYANAMAIDSNDEFGKLNDVRIYGDTLSITNADPFTLTRNSDQEIARGLYFKVADTASNVLRFYVMKKITEPGTYEIRGQVVSGTGYYRWDATNFAGFYYDLNDDVETESLSVSDIDGNVIPEGGLKYSTTIKSVDYEYYNTVAGWDQYPVIGFFGEEYIPINPSRADKFARLVLDSDDRYTIGTGEILDLGQGYAVEVKQIDVDGGNVWLEFTRYGEFVDDEIISVGTGIITDNTWESKLDGIQGENGVVVLRIHVNQVFQGENGNISQIEGLWLIDYANATAIESEDEFGKLNDVRINGDTLTIRNENIFTLTRGNEVEIGQGMFFKTANTSSSELRYYPFVEKTIEENNSSVLPVADFSTNVTSGYAPLPVLFTDLSQNTTSRSWDVNNDGIEDSNETSFVYEYASAGTYTAKLTAINANGTDTETTTITVEKIPINDSLEVRGIVYDGSNIDNIIDTYGDGTTLTINATQFSAFYYDIDNNVATETLSIRDVSGTEGNVIGEGGIVYQTTIQKVPYEYENLAAGWDTYPVLGLFGEQYIPINSYKADKFAKLILDSDDKHIVKTGETLDLGKGYAVKVKQIDIDSSKVWLEFTRDGELIDNEILSVISGSDNTWEVQLDGIQGENGVAVFRVHVNQIFQGEVDSIAQIEGLWLIDYANATVIEPDDEFGALNDVSLNGDTLAISNADTFTLTRNSYQEIASGLYFKVADTASNVLRFYVMKELTEPGIYEIRGQVASGTGYYRWDATNFAGFYYDLNDNIETESLRVSDIYANMILEGGLVYSATIQNVDYEYSNTAAGWDQYPVIGFFGEQYIPINPNRADKLAKLVLDSDDKYTIGTGETLDLGEGYAIEVKQIDVNGSRVWLEFTRDGEYVDDEIVLVDGNGSSTWDVELDNIQGEYDVVVLRVHVDQFFQGEVNSIVQIEGLWLIDYANAMTIESDDEFGVLNDVSLNDDTLTISNENIFTLTRGNQVEIGQGMYFKVADTPSSELRYYPFVERVIGEHNSKIIPVASFNSNVTSGNAPLAVQFTDTSQYATGISWDFNNDGLVDTSNQNPVHVYTDAGNYTVNLTASNANGTASKTATITVSEQSKQIVPVANFTANTTQGYAPLAVQFTDTSQYATGISWDFNNDGLADASSGTIVYVYTASGQYKVNLTASNANGTYSKSMTITVFAPLQPVLPIADFTANATSGYAPLAVQFTDSSQNAASWSWDFEGDGISDSGLQNPAHVYKIPGIYTVNLSAGNQNGTATKTAVITVLEKEDENETNILPVANFSTNVTSGYAPLSVNFTDLSQNSTSRSWDVNSDGIQDSDKANFVYEFTDPGNYTVNLTAINTNGTDSKSAVITVLQKNESKVLPVANFSTNVTEGRVPLKVQFIDLSQNATSISWDVNGDGIEDSNASSFVYEYTFRGDYVAKLTAINDNGTDEKTSIIEVYRITPPRPPNNGGGGGGSPEPAKNVEVKELSQVFITNGKAVQFNFTKNATCVVYVGFDAKKTVGKTTTIVEQLKNKSTLTSKLTDGEVYKYFNVWVGNSGFAGSENIENPVICFKVQKSWLQENNIDQGSVTLNRYSNKTWEQLPASLLKEDSKYLYFTADVPGYTFFAITGEEIAKETITEIRHESQIQNPEEKTGIKTGIIPSDMGQKPEPEKTVSTPGFLSKYPWIFNDLWSIQPVCSLQV